MHLLPLALALVSSLLAIQGAPVPAQHDDASLAPRSLTSSRITYYTGNQLNNPACGGPRPSPHSMIAAVQNGGMFQCGDHIHLQNGHKHVRVRVVDYCESCASCSAPKQGDHAADPSSSP